MTSAAVMVAPKEGFTSDTTSTEVLKHCPYHRQILFYYAARDEFLNTEGLVDMQEFMVRDNIIDRKKNLAIEEIMFREDMAMFWRGGYRLANCALDYYSLYSKILGSDNLATEWKRVHEINPIQFGMEAWTTWTRIIELWNRAEYTKAGKIFTNGMFPTVYE